MRIEYLSENMAFRETIALWFMQEWGERYPERTLEIWSETQTYPNKSKLPLTLVAIENNEVVGTVCLRTDGMTTHQEWKAWLSYLVVPKEHRGRGIAKALIKKSEEIAQELGINELHLFTRLEDPKLYANLEWEMAGRENYRGGMVSVMQKMIEPKLINQSREYSLFSMFKKHPYTIAGVGAIGVAVCAYLCGRKF